MGKFGPLFVLVMLTFALKEDNRHPIKDVSTSESILLRKHRI